MKFNIKSIISFLASLFFHMLLLIFLSITILKNTQSFLENNSGIEIEFDTLIPNESQKTEEFKDENVNKINDSDKIEVKVDEPVSSSTKEDIQDSPLVEEPSKEIPQTSPNTKENSLPKTELPNNSNLNNNSVEKKVDVPTPKKEDKIDERSLYKNNGQQEDNAAMLELKGWTWDEIPLPNDKSAEIGKIIFEITINDFGEIIGLKILERTVSLEVANIYKDSLINITFSRTSHNNLNNGNLIGKVTFYIRYK